MSGPLLLTVGCALLTACTLRGVPQGGATAPQAHTQTPAQTPAQTQAQTRSLRAALDAQVPHWLEAFAVPSVAVGYVARGETQFTAVYGWQSPDVPASAATLYDVASLTKPVTAEVVLRLASRGQLSLDEPMSAFWVDPDVAADARHQLLTPRIALSHRTGFANWRRDTDGQLRFAWAPGSRTAYSGEGYDYLLRFVEAKLGSSFPSIAEAVLFGPTRMAHSHYGGSRVPPLQRAWGHDGQGQWQEPPTRSGLTGADGLRSSIADYTRFVAAAAAAEGLSADVVRARGTRYSDLSGDCPPEVGPEVCPDAVGFGLGWLIFEYPGETIYFHSGADTGERAVAAFIPERELGFVLLSNGANGDEVIFRILDLLYDNRRWLQVMGPAGRQ